MAQRVSVVLEDDIDGGEATETVTFALDGTTYEIDLNDKNAAKLREALAPYAQAGRKLGKAGSPRGRKSASTGGPTPAEVREWASSNGFTVPSRGRIPADVRQAYDAAH